MTRMHAFEMQSGDPKNDGSGLRSIMSTGLMILISAWFAIGQVSGQDELVERRPPPPVEEFETDDDPADGIPDGWYNSRAASLVSPGLFGELCLRLINDKPSRPARISHAFGVDGSKYAALKVSFWIKVTDTLPGEHEGEMPGVMFDFLNGDLLTDSRGIIGPFDSRIPGGESWQFVSRILPVKPTTLDAIMTLGLLGSTGRMEIDRMTLELIPRQKPSTVNLVPNGDFLLGDSRPESWSIEGNTRRVSTPEPFAVALEMGRGRGRALVGLGRNVDDLESLTITAKTRSQGLRSSGGAAVSVHFVDERGTAIVDRSNQALIRIGGSSPSKESRATARVPSGAVGAIVQIDKTDDAGTLFVESIAVSAAPDEERGRWTPGDVPLTGDADEWPEYQPFEAIEPGSVLDTSTWGLVVPKPPLKVEQGKLTDAADKTVRLWGVSLLPLAAFPEGERAASIADNLHRLGANVVRFGDLDLAYGPGISLIDDARDDTAGIDAESFRRMNLFHSELAARGLFYSIELHSNRRFRAGDGVAEAQKLPAGGGPAAIFDPVLTKRIDEFSGTLLKAPRSGNQPKLIDDPRLAWVTMSGEISMMDADWVSFTDSQADLLKKRQADSKSGNVRRFHREIESDRYRKWANSLRTLGLESPLASLGHWKREADFAEVYRGPSIDLVEDRYYWPPQPWAQPGYRSALFDQARSFAAVAESKRNSDQAYILAQWCDQSQNAWSQPNEAADVLLGAYSAYVLDFDGLLRRGLAVNPTKWGSNATGTGGDRDIFNLPEALNGMPQVLAMMPHVASLLRRDRTANERNRAVAAKPAGKPARKTAIPSRDLKGWNPSTGVLRIDTPHTAGLVGRIGSVDDAFTRFGDFRLEFADDFGVIVMSSASAEPLASSSRLLVTLLGRATPTGLRYKDDWRKEVADPGRPPLRIEPVTGRFAYSGPGRITLRSVDNSGKPAGFVQPRKEGDTSIFELNLSAGGPHWEVELNR